MCEPLAQLVEQQPFKLWVVGSNPTRLTIFFKFSQKRAFKKDDDYSYTCLLYNAFNGVLLKIPRPYRLAWSRTSPFHGENMGSNPIRDAILLHPKILQFAKDNLLLGDFSLSGIPPMPKGVPQIKITFAVDANGIVKVTAQEESTGEKKGIIITNRSALSSDNINAIVENAKQHEKEDESTRLIIDKKRLLEELIDQASDMVKDSKQLWFWQRKTLQDQINLHKKALLINDLKTIELSIEKITQIIQKLLS